LEGLRHFSAMEFVFDRHRAQSWSGRPSGCYGASWQKSILNMWLCLNSWFWCANREVESPPLEIMLRCERCFCIFNLISPSWTNSPCLRDRKMQIQNRFLTESFEGRPWCISVSQNIRPMTTENKHSILDPFRVGFSWHFPSKWCEKRINLH
jgi:hypothetical protein